MPADAPVLSPESPLDLELAGRDESEARLASMACVGVTVVTDRETAESVVWDFDEVVEEGTDESVDGVVDELGDDDADCFCAEDTEELLADSTVPGTVAYPLTVVKPTNCWVVTVKPAIWMAGPAVKALAGSSQQSKVFPVRG
jgi:hypothetical protein